MNSDATEAALGLLGLSPQPPPSLVPLKRKQSDSPLDQEDYNPEAINCICGFLYDDGFSIACDDCSRWCHAACFDIVEGEVPEEWRCWVCVPRPVDRERAVKLQRARQRQTQEVQRRRISPGVDKKQRHRASTVDGSGGNSKRKRRSSMNTHVQHNSQIENALIEDEHVDIDEPWTHSYVPITKDIIPHQDTRDKLRRQAQHWRGITALSPAGIFPASLQTTNVPPKTTIVPLPRSTSSSLSPNTNPLVLPPSYAVRTTSPIPSSHFIAPYVSTITPSSAYLADPLNGYAHLGMPKPFVHLMGPPLDVALDSRITGDERRFLRSGCRPNAVLRPIICPQERGKRPSDDSDSESLTFGVFALRDLKANEEVVLGWEWDDGNAIHTLPALIESSHMFPPSHLRHLRNQMSGILHALSSTFTTCACGSRTKDCALVQMSAFVDGEMPEESPNLKRKVDLGPLVGEERGFRTREKVPFSGGMSGVEMVPSTSTESSLPLSYAAQAPRRRNSPEIVAHAFRSNNAILGESSKSMGCAKSMPPLLTISPATSPLSPHKNKKGKGRAFGECPEADESSSSASSPWVSGAENEEVVFTSGKQRRGRRRMAPDASPQSPRDPDPLEYGGDATDEELIMPPKMRKRWIHRSSEGLRSPGISNLRGFVPAGVRSDGDSNSEEERMDADEIMTDSKRMLPPPIPDSLDPPTIFSTNSNPRINTHDPQVSPSATFANLSLLSPVILGPSPPYSGSIGHTPPTSADSPPISLSTPLHTRLPSPLPGAISETAHASAGSASISPSSPPLILTSEASDRPRVRFASPEQLAISPPFGRSNESSELTPGSQLPTTPEHHTSDSAIDGSLTEFAIPSAAEPYPQTPRVKLSLKDFALRKKKQREEEMARVTISPEMTTQQKMLPAISVNGDDVRASGAVAPVDPKGSQSTNHDQPSGSDEVSRSDGSVLPKTEPVTDVLVHYTPPPRVPSPSPPHGLMHTPYETNIISLVAKIEVMNEPIPNGLVGADEPGPILPEPTATLVEAAKLSLPTPPLGSDYHLPSRRLSQEDGEIVSGILPSKQTAFVPRSRSPPTQPRSMHLPTTSNTVPTPHSAQSRRMSQSTSIIRAQAISNGIGSAARPLPIGPRALRAVNPASHSSASIFPAPNRLSFNPVQQFIPRGPSADRDRMDWERERNWLGPARTRGRGGANGWAR